MLTIAWLLYSKNKLSIKEQISEERSYTLSLIPCESTSVNKDTHVIALPNAIVGNMYLEVINIVQGVNLAILVYVVTTFDFLTSLKVGYLGLPLFAVTSLVIIINFWIRYYLDTEILHRSFSVLSITWFFAFLVAQGVIISFITTPTAWLGATSIFLFFGAGVYFLNLREIRYKQKTGVMPECSEFVMWQSKRMIELSVLSFLTISSTFLVTKYQALVFLVAIFAFPISLWQLAINRDYSKLEFTDRRM